MGWPKRKSADGAEGGSKSKKPAVEQLDYSSLDFTSDAKTKDGKKWNKKFASWNVNGVRAWMDKNAQSYITAEDPDVFCLQETKCDKSKIPRAADIEGYHVHWLSGDKDGYSGVGLYSKEEPKKVTYGINVEEHDKEGRVITAEFEDYYVVTAYIPNSGRGLPRLDYRTKEWDPAFREYVSGLDKKKPVIICGDMNVAHSEIDLSNPKSNRNKTAGFTDAEREQMTALIDAGFIDTFRHFHPDTEKVFSFWTYMMNARAKNAGWRLDYFLASKKLEDKLCDSLIRTEVYGSDHCPVVLLMNL